MMTLLFILTSLVFIAILFGYRRIAIALLIAALVLGMFWFGHHVTSHLKVDL